MSQRAQRLIEAARKLPVPEGTYAVGLGLMISLYTTPLMRRAAIQFGILDHSAVRFSLTGKALLRISGPCRSNGMKR